MSKILANCQVKTGEKHPVPKTSIPAVAAPKQPRRGNTHRWMRARYPGGPKEHGDDQIQNSSPVFNHSFFMPKKVNVQDI